MLNSNAWYVVGSGLRVWDCGLEDVQHAVTCLVPGFWGKLLSVQDDHILQTVGA